jgi:hypothetical protein
MWPITQPGLAMAIVDFTKDLSPLLIGLLGLVALSAGFIIVAAIQEHLSQTTERRKEPPAAEDRRDAA